MSHSTWAKRAGLGSIRSEFSQVVNNSGHSPSASLTHVGSATILSSGSKDGRALYKQKYLYCLRMRCQKTPAPCAVYSTVTATCSVALSPPISSSVVCKGNSSMFTSFTKIYCCAHAPRSLLGTVRMDSRCPCQELTTPKSWVIIGYLEPIKIFGLIHPSGPISNLSSLLFPISTLNLTWETCQGCTFHIVCSSAKLIIRSWVLFSVPSALQTAGDNCLLKSCHRGPSALTVCLELVIGCLSPAGNHTWPIPQPLQQKLSPCWSHAMATTSPDTSRATCTSSSPQRPQSEWLRCYCISIVIITHWHMAINTDSWYSFLRDFLRNLRVVSENCLPGRQKQNTTHQFLSPIGWGAHGH